jgi:hypothetical protein
MGIKHNYQSATANNGASEVSSTRWNEDHVIDGYLDLPEIADPVAPDATHLRVYAKDVAGKPVLKFMGASGVDMPVQAHIGMNNVRRVGPGAGTSATSHATALNTGYTSSATTFTAPSPTTGSLLSRTRRWTQATNTTAGAVTSHRSSIVECSRETGFFFTTRFYLLTMAAGQRGFFGLTSSAAAATNIDPLSATAVTIAHLGLAFNANTGNWKLTSNTASTIPTVVDLGASFPLNVTDLMELVLFCPPNGASVGYRVTNLTTGATTTGTIAANLPALTSMLAVQNWMTNNATAAAVAFGSTGWYLETDF